MEKKDAREFVVEGDGYADITLAGKVIISGAEVSTIRMREPTAGDMEAFHDAKGTDAAREIRTFANLCEISPDDVRRLSVRNYARLQAAFSIFST